jgi:hypothetical protein
MGFKIMLILIGFAAIINSKRKQRKKRHKCRKKRKKESTFFSAEMSECKLFDNKKFAETNKQRKKK